MKRTLLAVGVAVLASLMWIPGYSVDLYNPLFPSHYRVPIFALGGAFNIDMKATVLQTIFAAVAAAIVVNLLPRKPKK